jgi:hypothetical protein
MGDIAPGSYIVMARSGSGDQQLTAFQRIVLRPLFSAPPPYSVSMMLSPPLSIEGRLFNESSEAVDLHDARVSLISIDPDLPSPRDVSARTDGSFVVNGIVPGSYVVDVSSLPQDLYIKAARSGADDVLEKPFTLEARAKANALQILLGSDGGRLHVGVYNDKGALAARVRIVLVPDPTRRSRRDQYRLATSGDDGQTMIRGIPPGSYRVFAWEHLEENAYLNADYLQAYEASGVSVDITSGDNPLVSVRLIPKD